RVSSFRAAAGDQTVEARGDVVEGGGGAERDVDRGVEGGDTPCREEPEKNAERSEAIEVITTPDLIAALASDATPVRRLRPPLARAAAWLIFAVSLIAAITIVHGLRPDLAERLRQPVFTVGIVASFMTGILAAAVAFLLSLPDRSGRWLLLPA